MFSPCLVEMQVSKFTFRADFDSANLGCVKQGNSVSVSYLSHHGLCTLALMLQQQLLESTQIGNADAAVRVICCVCVTLVILFRNLEQNQIVQEVLLWTKKDCQGTPNERIGRSWFYFGVAGQNAVSPHHVAFDWTFYAVPQAVLSSSVSKKKGHQFVYIGWFGVKSASVTSVTSL